MSSLVFRITGDPASFKAAMGEVSSALDTAGKKANLVSDVFGRMGSAMTLGITVPAVAAGAAVIKAAADFEKLNKGLASVMGSTQAGAAEFKKLQEAAKLPGLGLEGAVQGSIRLQVLGKTADESRRLMAALGNSIALVGGGKDDFAEVTRQIGQMLSVGKVTKENLDTITERIPQISKIMIDLWGPQAVGDPAKFFEKAGISSKQFWDILLPKLEGGARASDTFANKLGNLEEAVKQSSARIGEKLLPTVEKVLPTLEKMVGVAADMVDGFTNLPGPIKNTAEALFLVGVAAGPTLKLVGGINAALVSMKAVAGVAGVALGSLFGATVIASIGQTMTAVDELKQRYIDLKKARDNYLSGNKPDPGSGLTESGSDLGKFNIDLKAVSKELGLFSIASDKATVSGAAHALTLSATAAAAEKHRSAHEAAKLPTVEMALLFERMQTASSKYGEKISSVAEIMDRYNAVTVAGAIQTAKLADERFRLNRALEDAPNIPVTWDIPKFEAPTFPGDFEEFKRMGRNIGPEGMQTREQFEGMPRLRRGGREQESWAQRSVREVGRDLASSVSSSGIGLIFDRPRNDAEKFKNEIAELEREIVRLTSAQGEMSEETARLKDEESKLLAAQTKGHNVAAQLAVVRAQIQESEKKGGEALIEVQNRLAEAQKRMGEELHKASFGFRALQAGKAVVEDLAKSITRTLIEGALTQLSKKLLDVGGVFGKVFGGGTDVIKSAVPDGGGLSGMLNQGGGGGAGAAASSGLMGTISAVSGVVSAVSGVIGNFQFAHMNTALGRIEESTRFSQIHLLNTLERANEFWPELRNIHARLVEIRELGVKIEGGGVTNQFIMEGNYILSDHQLGEFTDRQIRLLKSRGVQFT